MIEINNNLNNGINSNTPFDRLNESDLDSYLNNIYFFTKLLEEYLEKLLDRSVMVKIAIYLNNPLFENFNEIVSEIKKLTDIPKNLFPGEKIIGESRVEEILEARTENTIKENIIKNAVNILYIYWQINKNNFLAENVKQYAIKNFRNEVAMVYFRDFN